MITKPVGTEFDFAEANDYYAAFKDKAGGEGTKIFCCTDVTFLNDTLYVVTGYDFSSEGLLPPLSSCAEACGTEAHAGSRLVQRRQPAVDQLLA